MPACPGCHQDQLTIVASLSLAGDSRSDDICFQLFRCSHCGQPAAGAYEESRRGSLDSECWDHYAYPIVESSWQRCQQLLAVCPNPDEEACGCCAHQQLGRYDASGRWLGLKALPD